MNKKRFNLRMVAAMVACLAVTTVFATCGKGSGNDDGGNGFGSKKSELAGYSWSCNTTRLVMRFRGGEYVYVYEPCIDYYMFYGNGKFEYFPFDDLTVYYKGTYSTSNGKINFKNVNRLYRYDDEITTSHGVNQNIEMEYKIEKDAQGEYILIGNLSGFKTENISRNDMYRKSAEKIE